MMNKEDIKYWNECDNPAVLIHLLSKYDNIYTIENFKDILTNLYSLDIFFPVNIENAIIETSSFIRERYSTGNAKLLRMYDLMFTISEYKQHAGKCCEIIRDIIQYCLPIYRHIQKTETEYSVLAKEIKNTGNYTLVGILADCLEDHNFKDKSIINHFRNNKRHYYGCWGLNRLIYTEQGSFYKDDYWWNILKTYSIPKTPFLIKNTT